MNHLVNPIDEEAKAILKRHVHVGIEKAVSYLPIYTIERVLGLKVEDYRSLVEHYGNRCIIFAAEGCCIKSGAVFAYSADALQTILEDHFELLSKHQWPVAPLAFVQRIASEWLDANDPILPVIRKAFGSLIPALGSSNSDCARRTEGPVICFPLMGHIPSEPPQ